MRKNILPSIGLVVALAMLAAASGTPIADSYERNLWQSKQCWIWMPPNDKLCNPRKYEADKRRRKAEEDKRFGCSHTYINERGEDTGECN